ncbi:glutamate--cysteine ligase [Cardiobacteriaceae bacterium TAE3-ERU3]|nr:glutamate--cysteine ligase [Cardiobacteriaceae bacterium TAE3-ERU3]
MIAQRLMTLHRTMQTYNNLTLHGGQIGIEREMLRTNPDATLATTRHPLSLGRTYTHPNITIDFAEALLELVTEPHSSPQAAYDELLALHRYTRAHTQNEQFWAPSMPCILPDNLDSIDIGHFGSSNGGKLKRLYRVGLHHRYGMAMQMIAGVHFNYSPPEALWTELGITTASERNARYMGMLRNLQRHGWLIPYLFGASPAVHSSFQPAQGVLNQFDPSTLGWQKATSLRMSDLGYQNKAQFTVSFNDLKTYIHDLATAVMTPAPAFEYMGIKDEYGNYQQISTHILQIANEYYTAARPKQPLKAGELPAIALHERGIGYVELRLLDVNPYDPCGVSIEQLHFLEVFMLHSFLSDSPPFTHADWNELNSNRLRTACCGVNGITLYDQRNPRSSSEWATALLDAMQPIAEQLDQQNTGSAYSDSIATLRQQIEHNQRMPQRVQAELAQTPFIEWAQALTEQHSQYLSQPCDASTAHHLDQLGEASRQAYDQREAAAKSEPTFDDYLDHYFDPLKKLLKQR